MRARRPRSDYPLPVARPWAKRTMRSPASRSRCSGALSAMRKWPAALAELKATGTKLLNETPVIGHGNCRIAFIDPNATGNILFELAEMPPGGAAH